MKVLAPEEFEKDKPLNFDDDDTDSDDLEGRPVYPNQMDSATTDDM